MTDPGPPPPPRPRGAPKIAYGWFIAAVMCGFLWYATRSPLPACGSVGWDYTGQCLIRPSPLSTVLRWAAIGTATLGVIITFARLSRQD